MNCGLSLVAFVLCLLFAVNGQIFKLKFEFGCKEGDGFVTITDVKFRNPKGQVEVYGVALVGNPEGSFQEIPISHWRMQPQEAFEAIENCKERLEEESKNNNKPLAITAMYVCDESDKLFQIAVQLRNLNDIELDSFYKIQQFLNQDVQANPAQPQQTIRERVSFVANQARRIARERREALEQMGPLGSLDEVNEHRALIITEAQKVRTFIRENQLNSAENGLLTAVINELQEDIDRGIASLTEEANQIPMGGVHDAAQGFISNMSEFMRAAPPDTEEEARERVQKLFGIKEEGCQIQ